MVLRKFLMIMMVLGSLIVAGCARSEVAQVDTATESQAAEVAEPAGAEPAQTEKEAEVVSAIPEPAENQAAEEVTEAAVVEPAETEAEAATAGVTKFEIIPQGTEARFFIDEVLMGQDKTVVGTTSDVTGEIRVDPANPTAAQLGPIRINARDLATDDNRRTGQLRNNILKSARDQYQYIVFTPTAIEGLPESVTVGQPFTFRITGDLTILDTTKSVTFDMTVTPNSETELTGLGSTVILYPDYGIAIPSVPFVADVTDEVRLELEFTAVAAAS